MLELVGDFFGRKKKSMGAGISGGGPRGAHEAGGRALDPRGQVLTPLAVCSVPYFLKYSRKNHPLAQSRVLAHLAAIFDLLAQSIICKTILRDCSLVCNSSNHY